MPEAELHSLTAGFLGEQVVLHEPVAGLLDLGEGDAADECAHRGGLERVAGHRAEREHRPLDRVEPVEPCGEQGVDGGWEVVRRAPLADVRHQLLEEQGVAAGHLGDPSFLVPVETAAGERLEQRLAGRAGERREPQDGRLADAARPVGPVLERVGARHQDEERGHVAEPAGRVEQQVQERGLGPVHVVDHDHDRPEPGERGDQPHERPARLLAGLGLPGRHQAGDPVRHGRLDPEPGGQPVHGLGAGGVEGLQHDLAQRPVGDALPVGGAAAGQDHAAIAGDRPQLGGEARLADARLAEDREELR